MNDIFYYKALDHYLVDILKDLQMSMQIRVIKNILFIEKVRFLRMELRTTNEMFNEILQQEYTLIKSIPANLVVGKDSISLQPSYKFIYQVNDQDVLFYFVWVDNLGNIIKPSKPFEIINDGDTLTLN